MKFHLRTQGPVQGQFTIRPVNLAFVFQVNCPGCFIHGIPLVDQLHARWSDRVGFLGISTAFEDFGLNTELHTRQLLQEGTLVGETRKFFEQHAGTTRYTTQFQFPVAFDRLVKPVEFLTEGNLALISGRIPEFAHAPRAVQEDWTNRVKAYYGAIALIAETFTLNQLKGTPSFILFDDRHTVLDSVFGVQDDQTMNAKLCKLVG